MHGFLKISEGDKKIDHRISAAKKEEAATPTDAPNGAPVCAAASFALIGSVRGQIGTNPVLTAVNLLLLFDLCQNFVEWLEGLVEARTPGCAVRAP